MSRFGIPSVKKLPLVILHVGTEKKGTTSIQEFINRNWRQMARQNIHTLKGFGRPNNRDFVSYFQNSLDDWARAKSIRSQEEKTKYLLKFESSFARSIKFKNSETSRPVFLISSEHFSSRLRTKEELESVRDFLMKYFESITIICYFRPQEEMAISLHSTGL